MNINKKVLIVGGVAGGATAAARLRRLDENAEIILFERGGYISYANCGLPYHIGDVIKSRDSLIVTTPEVMAARYKVDVRIKNEVISIDRENKNVTVKKVDTGETYTEDYDVLVLSTGSSPFRPGIPGIESKRIMTLWTIPDTDRIRAAVHENGVKSAVVIGGGFIGIEMAENLNHVGVKVDMVEMLDQVMAPLDYEMAQLVHENIEQNGVTLTFGDGVSSFEDNDDKVSVILSSGKKITSDLIILSIGVRPNSELAKGAGLEINARGAIVVDDYMRTTDPSIYAVGDVIEVEDFIDKSRTMIQLAGPANKQARIAADNIAGANESYGGTQGTSIAKAFDLTVGGTGANEKTLIKRGLVKGKDYESIIIKQNSHAGYYPGATPMTIKLLFSTDGKKIYGAQIVGTDGVDKRTDIIGATIRLGGGIHELKSLELGYAPPYSSAKDPVNMAGFVAENVIKGIVSFAPWNIVETRDPEKTILLDVSEEAERMIYSLDGALNITFGELRNRLSEIDKRKEIIVFCVIGVRSYSAARILMQNGFDNVRIYPAGTKFYRSTHYKENKTVEPEEIDLRPLADSSYQSSEGADSSNLRLDCSGLQCPGPIMKVYETIKDMKDGDTVDVTASDPGFTSDIAAWCRRTGNTLVASEKRGNEYSAIVKKGIGENIGTASVAEKETGNGKSLVVFSGDLDRVLASFIIANGAAAMGRPVTMFFTFWGLNVLRKPEKQNVKKTLIESMFGFMMPRGTNQLEISKLNMGGLGTSMMKRIMKDKNVDSLDYLIKKAMEAGVKIVACTMSMDVMGIKKEELIEGIEFGGVGTFLGDAEESDISLFI